MEAETCLLVSMIKALHDHYSTLRSLAAESDTRMNGMESLTTQYKLEIEMRSSTPSMSAR